jgi:hypothetical protein
MHLNIKNLGPLREANFELGDLTIICGRNNTGKTYATYALYGFLSFWEGYFFPHVDEKKIDLLLSEGSLVIDLADYIARADEIIQQACKEYSVRLPRIFASSDKLFANVEYAVSIPKEQLVIRPEFSRLYGSAKKDQFSITKGPDETLEISLFLARDRSSVIPKAPLQSSIGTAIKEIIFAAAFPHPFIISTERTGAAIFRKELDFARNRLLEQMNLDRNTDPFTLLDKVYADYPLPVRKNVDFTRRLEEVSKRDSFIAKHAPELLADFSRLIGGQYKVVRDELYYVPDANKRLRLTMDESSSAVRSLLDLGFYLHHVAKPGDLLMVDEPELNLHPENQRGVARLLARLVNLGIKVFITTHSDYIVKELNTLIMLNQSSRTAQQLRKKEKYRPEELIRAEQIRVYMAQSQPVLLEGCKRKTSVLTLAQADIDPRLGIEAESFDHTIDEMNRIQEALLFAEEDA